MARKCSQCGKQTSTGNNVSHSHRKTKRTFLPNLVSKRLLDKKTGKMTRKLLCTRCLKAMAK